MAGDTLGSANKVMKNLGSSTDATTGSLFKLKDTLNNLSPDKAFESALNINQQIVNLNREILQRGPETVKQLEKVLTDTTLATLEFGVSIEDNIDLFSKLNQSLQRTNFFTKNQIIDMQLIAKNTGLAAEEMAKFEEAFDTLGLSTDYMIDNLEDMSNMARNYGLNVNQFMGTIADNVKLLAGYNFKNGIDGLTEMVARAQSLRFDFNKTVELADDLMDPEKAIEMAASFQMMGGEIGKLGDPMQMLYMAQQDMGGLQDSIMEAAASAVSFNKETGKFDIPVTQMYRLRTMADQLSMSYSDLASQAMRSKQEQEKLSVIEGLGTIPMEYQELVKNLSEFDTEGELKIKLPSMDDSIEVSRLTGRNFEELKKLQELEGKSQKEIADKQLSVQEKILTQISKIEFQPGAALLTEGRDAVVGITSSLKTFYGATSDFIEENLDKMISTSQDFVTQYIEKLAGIDLQRLANEEGYANKVFNQMLDEFKADQLDINTQKTNVYGKDARVVTGEEAVTQTSRNTNDVVNSAQVRSEVSDTTSVPKPTGFINLSSVNNAPTNEEYKLLDKEQLIVQEKIFDQISKIEFSNTDEIIDVSKMTASNFKELKDLQELVRQSQNEIADKQLSVQGEILDQISKIEFQPDYEFLTEGRDAIVGITTSLETFYGATSKFVDDNLAKIISTSEDVMTQYVQSVTTPVGSQNNNQEVLLSDVQTDTESETKSAPIIDFASFNSNQTNSVAEVKFNQPMQISLDVNVRGNQMAANEIASIIRNDSEIQGNLKTLIKEAITESSTGYA